MMPELNTTEGLDLFEEAGFDTLTVVNMGEGVLVLSQIAEDGTLHNVVIGPDQAEQLGKLIIKVLG